MNSQQETPPVIVLSVILTSLNDWDEQIKVIKAKANNIRLWEYINLLIPETDLLQLKEPI